MTPIELHAIANTSAAGILVCIAGGIPIALIAWTALRVWGRQNSSTRFAVWYGALLAISLLPLIERMRLGDAQASLNGAPSHSLIVVSSSWAVVVFTLWAIFAAIALLRVAAGLLKLRALRRNCRSIDVAC